MRILSVKAMPLPDTVKSLRESRQNALVVLALVGILALVTIGIRLASRQVTLGHDYITFWHAGRYMFLEGGNPYSSELTLRSQWSIYGREALPAEDQAGFSYPPYSLLAILPFLFFDFEWSQSAWMAFNILAWLATAIFLRLRPYQVITLLFFFPITFGIALGNFAPVVALALLWGFRLAFVTDDHAILHRDLLATGLIAWTTVKPQLSWLFLILFIAIAILQRRARLVIFSAGWLALYIAFSALLVPTWMSDWLARIEEYRGYVTMGITLATLLDGLIPGQIAQSIVVGAGLISALLLIWLITRTIRNIRWWIVGFAWAGLVTFLFHPHGLAYEQVAFLIPLFLWAGCSQQTPAWLPIYWLVVLIFSWIAYALAFQHPRWDYTPVLLNGIWVVWLVISHLRSENQGLSPGQATTKL